MVTVVIGGSGSGKSAYAEQLITDMEHSNPCFYLATMQVYDEEGRKKIQRHRDMRAGKGFLTIEQPVNIEEAVGKILKSIDKTQEPETVLLECMSNLVANEMFSTYPNPSVSFVVPKVVSGIRQLIEKTNHLVIVTNNVFEDGDNYDQSTLSYMEALGQINEAVSAYADEVIEVVAGIPVEVKKNQKYSINAGKEQSMELYLGGRCQGKLNYVEHTHKDRDYLIYDGTELAIDEEQLKDQLGKEKIIINHFHLWIRTCLEQDVDFNQLVEVFMNLDEKQNLIIISDEIGNGIVPMDPFERNYREQVGRTLCQIAAKAGRVERIICGMGQRLK